MKINIMYPYSTASKLNQPLSDVTRTVRLPGEVFDIRSIGLWCVRATQNFGHVIIPDDLMSLGVIVPATAADDDAPVCFHLISCIF